MKNCRYLIVTLLLFSLFFSQFGCLRQENTNKTWIIVLEDSGKQEREIFETQRQLVLEIVERSRYEEGLMIEIYKFNTTMNLVVEMTDDYDLQVESINSMKGYMSSQVYLDQTEVMWKIAKRFQKLNLPNNIEKRFILSLLRGQTIDTINQQTFKLKELLEELLVYVQIFGHGFQIYFYFNKSYYPNYYQVQELIQYRQLFFQYDSYQSIQDLLDQADLAFESIFQYDIQHVYIWDDWNPMNRSRLNGSHIVRYNFESNRLVIKSTGFSKSLRCRFRSTENEKIIDSIASFINLTHFWCRSPQGPGSYRMNLFDDKFNRSESTRVIELDIKIADLTIVNQIDPLNLKNTDRIYFQLKHPDSITMREWWMIEKNSRDPLEIYDKYLFHYSRDNCYHSWETTDTHYCADCSIQDRCDKKLECKDRKTVSADKKYCLQCQDSFDYCGKPYLSLCQPSTELYPYSDDKFGQVSTGCNSQPLQYKSIALVAKTLNCELGTQSFIDSPYLDCDPDQDQFHPICEWSFQESETDLPTYTKIQGGCDPFVTDRRYYQLSSLTNLREALMQCSNHEFCTGVSEQEFQYVYRYYYWFHIRCDQSSVYFERKKKWRTYNLNLFGNSVVEISAIKLIDYRLGTFQCLVPQYKFMTKNQQEARLRIIEKDSKKNIHILQDFKEFTLSNSEGWFCQDQFGLNRKLYEREFNRSLAHEENCFYDFNLLADDKKDYILLQTIFQKGSSTKELNEFQYDVRIIKEIAQISVFFNSIRYTDSLGDFHIYLKFVSPQYQVEKYYSMIDTRVFNKSQLRELYSNTDLYLPKIRFISNPYVKLRNGSYHPRAVQVTLDDLRRCSMNLYENERECVAHALDYFEFKNLPVNRYTIYLNYNKLHQHYDPQIYLQGVTIIFETIEKFKEAQQYIPSDIIIGCSRTAAEEQFRSYLLLNRTKGRNLIEGFREGTLILTFGCDLYPGYWGLDLNSRITGIDSYEGEEIIRLELTHDIFLSDIFQDIDFDSSNYPNQTLGQILSIYEGLDSRNQEQVPEVDPDLSLSVEFDYRYRLVFSSNDSKIGAQSKFQIEISMEIELNFSQILAATSGDRLVFLKSGCLTGLNKQVSLNNGTQRPSFSWEVELSLNYKKFSDWYNNQASLQGLQGKKMMVVDLIVDWRFMENSVSAEIREIQLDLIPGKVQGFEELEVETKFNITIEYTMGSFNLESSIVQLFRSEKSKSGMCDSDEFQIGLSAKSSFRARVPDMKLVSLQLQPEKGTNHKNRRVEFISIDDQTILDYQKIDQRGFLINGQLDQLYFRPSVYSRRNDNSQSTNKIEIYGYSHAMTFDESRRSLLIQGSGDFHLVEFIFPSDPESCFKEGIISGEHYDWICDQQKLQKDRIGVQVRFLNSSGSNLLDSLAFYVGTDLIEIRTFNHSNEYSVSIKINGVFQRGHQTYDFYQFRIFVEKSNKKIKLATPLFTLVSSPYSAYLTLSSTIESPDKNKKQETRCSIDTRGIVGSWLDKRLYFKNSTQALELDNLQNEKRLEYIESWRVQENEKLISDWKPEYSEHQSEAKVALPDPNYEGFWEACNESVINQSLGFYKLRRDGCISDLLDYQIQIIEQKINDCASDSFSSQSYDPIDLVLHSIESDIYWRNIICLSPESLVFQQVLKLDENFRNLYVYNVSYHRNDVQFSMDYQLFQILDDSKNLKKIDKNQSFVKLIPEKGLVDLENLPTDLNYELILIGQYFPFSFAQEKIGDLFNGSYNGIFYDHNQDTIRILIQKLPPIDGGITLKEIMIIIFSIMGGVLVIGGLSFYWYRKNKQKNIEKDLEYQKLEDDSNQSDCTFEQISQNE